jgi:hypothetical protein
MFIGSELSVMEDLGRLYVTIIMPDRGTEYNLTSTAPI